LLVISTDLKIMHLISVQKVRVKVDNPCTGLDKPWGFQEFEFPIFYYNQQKRMV